MEPGDAGVLRGPGTLLGFEESGIPLDLRVGWDCSSVPPRTGHLRVEGRGGRVVCELDSGREHLPMPLHQEVSDF